MTRRAALGLAVGAFVAGSLAVAAPAYAAPDAVNDSYQLYASGTYTVTPLDNDRSVFSLPPTSGPLSLCGIAGVDDQRLYVTQSDDSIVVEVRDGVRGRTQFSYDTCQGDQRDTATVTIDITLLTDVQGAKKQGRVGKVVFTNPNAVPVDVSYGSASSGHPDATRTVPAGRSITIATTRKSIYWLALYSDAGVLITVGDDLIGKLQVKTR